jgi:hypothetical protein
LGKLVIEKRDPLNFMQHSNNPTTPAEAVPGERVPEARYAYYRRCQVFRKGGEQCKAPAEKGSHICYAHAGQLATALRRERERRAVLAEAVAEMRRRGSPECEMADLFTDFKSINVTLAVMTRAVIAGRIDCKTAGQMVVHLQTCSKLLWQIHRKGREGRKENQESPQICSDERRLDREQELPALPASQAAATSMIGRIIHAEAAREFEAKVRAIPEKPQSLRNGKWEQTRAA